MGTCCCKKSMSTVDNSERRRRAVSSGDAALAVPTVDFDVLLPEGVQDLSLGIAARLRMPEDAAADEESNSNQSICTVSEYNTYGDVPLSLSTTVRDDLSLTMVTNGCEDVRASDVDRFVKNILSMSEGKPHNMLEGGFIAASTGSNINNRHNRSIVRANITVLDTPVSFTTEQRRYLNSGANHVERLSRLAELEQMSRQEIFSAWQVNSVFLQLARSRLMPTVRRRRVPSATSQSGVLVIHARDMDAQSESFYLREGYFKSPPTTICTPSEKIKSKEATKHTTVEHFQLFALTGRDISITGNVQAQVVNDSWDFLSLSGSERHLNAGNVYFRFLSSPVANLQRDSLDLIRTFINLTSFRDEVVENNVPKVDIFSEEAQNKYVAILVKAMYILPGVRLGNLTPELLASLDYQRNCQPGDNKFEELDIPYTFRTVKTVIRFVFSITIQMRVSEITDPELLQSFRGVDGMTPTRVLMLERTKNNIQKKDSTVKVRSLLLYYAVNDGILVNNQTIILNSSLPRMMSSLMQTFGSQGAAEAAQTAVLTRRYMIHRFGGSRS